MNVKNQVVEEKEMKTLKGVGILILSILLYIPGMCRKPIHKI